MATVARQPYGHCAPGGSGWTWSASGIGRVDSRTVASPRRPLSPSAAQSIGTFNGMSTHILLWTLESRRS